jgi:signal transduction histidine kinase/ActR/RegA family two-component response regulator
MANNFSFTGLSEVASKETPIDSDQLLVEGVSNRILKWVSYSCAFVSLMFLIAFAFDESISVSWFFVSQVIAFLLIPILAKSGFENTAKFILILYVDVSIVLLSSIFEGEVYVQFFFIPTMGLAILLFDYKYIHLRNISIMISVISFFVIDFISIDSIILSEDNVDVIRWSVLTASFITTWIIFNTFSESKEKAEQATKKLLEKEQDLNKQLSHKQDELQTYIDQLEVTSLELEKSARAKSDFLATMSHEIRTPMNAILGMTHLLKEDDPREDQLESINILDFSGRTLLALINDILDFSKIDAGKIEFEQTEFELQQLVSTISETFKVTATNKRIELKTEIEDEMPNTLIGDPARLTQILNNLVSNALKFTEKGSVKINVKALEETDDEVKIEFKVIDTGIGIEEDRLDSVFESFTQANTTTTRLFGGTGLGLSISKQLTELQGGRIFVESEIGKGSTFSVQLLFPKGTAKEKIEAGVILDEFVKLKGTRVLLAEDNPVNQKVMTRFLERWEIITTVVNDGYEVIAELESNDYDIILMDLQMPELNGFETTERIRAFEDEKKRKIPIVALTAAALKEVKDQVQEVGMDAYVTKPFNPVELKKKISELTRL